ncbi:hypothetical protein G3W31_26335, partial [Klebsiella pneumoniae]|nr:hypothetical protein [Klebsiella pneumoniae]
SAQIREILISESAWEEMTCLFAPSLSSLTDEELREKYIKIQDADSIPWQSLQEAAFKRTCISLGRNCEINLSLRKRVIAWIAGDMP